MGRGTNGSSNEYFKGIIREVLVFNSELDDYFQKRVEGYLANKWGSKASLSNQHPFKVTPPTFGGTQSITVAHTNLGVDTSDNVPFMSIFELFSPYHHILQGVLNIILDFLKKCLFIRGEK